MLHSIVLTLGWSGLLAVWGGILWLGRKRLRFWGKFSQLNRREAEEIFSMGSALLRAGVPLDEIYWARLENLSNPWGKIAPPLLKGIRSQGGKLMPTLSRLEELARVQREGSQEARARVAPAVAQAWVSFFLVLASAGALPTILTEVSKKPWAWGSVSCVALALAWCAVIWIREMADRAIFLGVSRSRAFENLWAPLFGEGLLAWVRAGVPADLAWTRMMDMLQEGAPRLAQEWGVSLWEDPLRDPIDQPLNSLKPRECPTATLGNELREVLRVSLLEGRSAGESIEAALQRNQFQKKVKLDQHIRVLTQQALIPLFLLVVPAVFLLLGVALFWVFEGVSLE